MKCGFFGAVMKCAAALWVASAAAGAAATEPPQGDDEPPRIQALLEHAWAAESGRGEMSDRRLALALYCRAGRAGSAEGYFRVGLLLVEGPGDVRDIVKGRGYLALAAQLGHERAAMLLEDAPAVERTESDCADFEAARRGASGKGAPQDESTRKLQGNRCHGMPAGSARPLRAPAAS